LKTSLSLEDLRREPAERPAGISEEVRGEIFEEQLTGWNRVPSLWPSRRDLDAFDRRLEWSFHSVAVALRDAPLLEEEN